MKKLALFILLISFSFPQYTNLPARSAASSVVIAADINQLMENIRYLGGYVTNVTNSITISDTAQSGIFNVIPIASSLAITLPKASNVAGKRIIITKADTSAFTVTILPQSPGTIIGKASVTLSNAYEYRMFYSDNTNWIIISKPSIDAEIYGYISNTYGQHTNSTSLVFTKTLDISNITTAQNDMYIDANANIYLGNSANVNLRSQLYSEYIAIFNGSDVYVSNGGALVIDETNFYTHLASLNASSAVNVEKVFPGRLYTISNAIFFQSPATGTITNIEIDTLIPHTNNNIRLNARINGQPLYSGTNLYPTIVSGASNGYSSPSVNSNVSIGDWISYDLPEVGSLYPGDDLMILLYIEP